MYQELTSTTLLRCSDGATVPKDPDNRDYQEALLWLANNDLIEALPNTPILYSVTMRQAQLALLQLGKLDAVLAALANQPRASQVAWAAASVVVRDDPLVVQLATMLGLPLNDLFSLASTL